MTAAVDPHLTRVRVVLDLDLDLSDGADGPAWAPLAEWDAEELSDALQVTRPVELKAEVIR